MEDTGDSAQQQQQPQPETVQTYDAIDLKPHFAFGLNARASGCVVHMDTNHTMQPVGRCIGISTLDSPDMTFILPREAGVKGVTAVAVSPNRRFVALGERSSAQVAQVSVVNLTTLEFVRTLVYGESKEVLYLCFSGDEKYLLAQTGKPDFVAVVWEWETGTVAASAKFVATSGRRHLQLWRGGPGVTVLQAQQLGGMREETTPQNYTDHTWLLGDILVAATDVGELLVFERGQLKQVVAPFQPEAGLSCLAPFTRGIVAAGGTSISILERNEQATDGNYLAVRNTCVVPSELFWGGGFSCMSVPLSETNVVCATSSAQLFQLNLDLANMKLDLGYAVAPHLFAHPKGLHSGAIVGLDVAMRKPLAVTCGSDRTVRVWNWVTRRCELAKAFKEEPSSVAMHPLGLQCVVGFADKLKVCSLLVDDIRPEHGFPIKGCREVRYSHGGQFIAAVAQVGINIYSTITNTLVSTLRGHVGQVKALAWSKDDKRLVSVSVDGAIYEWSTQTWQRAQDNVLKTCAYTAVSYNDQGTAVLCAASDKAIREIVEGNMMSQMSSGPDVLTAMVFSGRHKAVFAGTSAGSVRVFEYPLTGAFKDIALHSGSVTRVKLSPNEDFLFSTSEDGSLYMLSVGSVTDVHAQMPAKANRELDEPRWLDLVLVGQQSMRERYQAEADLNVRMEDVAKSVDAQVASRSAEYQAKIADQAAQFEYQLRLERQKNAEMVEDKAALLRKHEAELKRLELENREAQQMAEGLHRKRVAELNERADQEAAEARTVRETCDKALADLRSSQAAELERQRSEFAAELQRERERLHKTELSARDADASHQAEVRMQEEEFEYGMAQAKERASLVLQIERDSTGALQGVHNALKRRYEESLREQAALRMQVENLKAEVERAHKTMREKEEENAHLHRDLSERSDTVAQKEARLTELKQKNQELEKFRYVLEYKIAELKEDLEPQEETISEQKQQIAAMNEELQTTLQRFEEMRHRHVERGQKVEAFNKQLVQLKTQLAEKDKYVHMLVENLHRIYMETESADWKNAFKQMYQTCVTQDTRRNVTQEDQDRMKELARQREYMEHSLEVLKHKVSRSEHRHRLDLERRTSENVELISEMNRLRRENKQQKEQITELQNKLDSGSLKAAERLRTNTRGGNPLAASHDALLSPSDPSASPPPTAGASQQPEAAQMPLPPRRGSVPALRPTSEPPAGAGGGGIAQPLNAGERLALARAEQALESKTRQIEMLKLEVQRLNERLDIHTKRDALMSTAIASSAPRVMGPPGPLQSRSKAASSPQTLQKQQKQQQQAGQGQGQQSHGAGEAAGSGSSGLGIGAGMGTAGVMPFAFVDGQGISTSKKAV
eukprot:m51a1_g12064 hypothetical protein (1353) ;mRNA; f:43-5360